MDKIVIRKNLLDIQERNYRLYFTTQFIVTLTVISILITISAIESIFHRYETLIIIGAAVDLFFMYNSFQYKKKADEKIREIETLILKQLNNRHIV